MNTKVRSSKLTVAIIMILILAIGSIGAVVVATTQDNSPKGRDITTDSGIEMIPPSDGVVYDLEAEAKALESGNTAMVYYAPGELSSMNEAEIGGKGYATLQAAIDSIANGGTATIKILTSEFYNVNFDITGKKIITFDLNQQTVTTTSDRGFDIVSGSITFQNGTIINSRSGNAMYIISGTTNVTNCTISSLSGIAITVGKLGAVNVNSSSVTAATSSAIFADGGKVIINGDGTIITSWNVTVEDIGKKEGATIVIGLSGRLDVQGGKVQNTDDHWAVWNSASKENITISATADVGKVGPVGENAVAIHYRRNAVDATGYVNGYTQDGGNFDHTVRTNGFERDGYFFTGWTLNPDGTGVKYAPGDKITSLTSSIDLYAQWVDRFGLKLNLNSGELDNPPTEYMYGEETTLPLPFRYGHTFAGWHSNKELSGTAITTITATDTGDKEFWAKWTVSTYKVKLNSNGGTNAALTSYTFGKAVTLPVPTRNGYTFKGWYHSPGFWGIPTPAIKATDAGDKEYWAWWISINYKVKLNSNGGTNTAVTSYACGTGAILPESIKTGYTFAGWYNNAGLSGPAITTITVEDFGNKEFWAKWIVNTYTITWIVDGKAVEEDYDYGTKPEYEVIKLQDAQYTYTLVGWIRSGETAVADPISVVGNETYTAIFAGHLRVYDIVVDTPEGTPTISGGKVEYGSEYKFKVERKKGYNYKKMVVKVGDEVLSVDADGYYTVKSVNGNLKINIEGVKKSSNAWWIILVVLVIVASIGGGLLFLYIKGKPATSDASPNGTKPRSYKEKVASFFGDIFGRIKAGYISVVKSKEMEKIKKK